jgi:Trk K+ transport system NAD-binding subunit
VNIVIIGAGEVGRHLAENLSNREHSITIIEAIRPLSALKLRAK